MYMNNKKKYPQYNLPFIVSAILFHAESFIPAFLNPACPLSYISGCARTHSINKMSLIDIFYNVLRKPTKCQISLKLASAARARKNSGKLH